jgi:hypothetical protein
VRHDSNPALLRRLGPTVAILFATAGCGGSEPVELDRSGGRAKPDGIPSTPTPAGTSPSAEASGESAADPLAGVDPCTLVPAAVLTRLHLEDQTSKTLGKARVCRWRYEGATLRDSYTVDVVIFSTVGIDDLIADDPRSTTVNGRPAKSASNSSGACVVSLHVTESSRVDSSVVGGEKAGACRFASELAAAVEPRLPS